MAAVEVEKDQEILERILGSGEFPPELISNYRKARFAADRLSHGPFSAGELVLLCVLSGIDPRPAIVQKKQDDAAEVAKAQELKQRMKEAGREAPPVEAVK